MIKRLPGVAAIVALTLTNLPAQSADLAADVDFIRGLVSELKFIDLAQYEVEQLKKIHKDSSDFKNIAQLAIEVSLQGAKNDPDMDRRISLFQEAIDKSTQFIERYEGDPVAQDARVTLADACIEFGFFLNDKLDLARDEEPERVPELEEQAAKVFRQGVEATNACQQAFKNANRNTDAFVAWLRRGILYREHARAVKNDRAYLCGEASTTLEELIFEVGEETILGQKALFEMSKIEEVRGNLDKAIRSYQDAIAAIWDALNDENVDLPESAQRIMFNMMQEIFDRLATTQYKAGRANEVGPLVDELDKRIKKFRTEPDPRFFDSMLLTKAQADATSPKQTDVSAALKAAKEINERHPADFVGLKAKNLIRDILRSSSDLVTGELLLEVAIGDYQSKSYEAAAAGFKRALNRMDDAARAKFGFETWTNIARCNERMQRYLEATMAYSRALTEFGTSMQGSEDPQVAKLLAATANKAKSMFRRVTAASGKDETFNVLADSVDKNQRAFDPDAATAGDYGLGMVAKNNRQYEKARDHFFKVKSNYPKYELAMGHGIECMFRLGDFAGARAKIKELQDYVKATPIPEEERERRGFRPQALAWVHYTEGRMLYEEAQGREGAKPDLTKFRDVEKHFLEFEAVHLKHATLQAAKVNEMLGHAYLETGDEAKATERYSKLKALGETTPDAHKALGVLMFSAYRDRAAALQAEIKSLLAGKKPTAATQAKLTETRRKAMDIGLDYARTVGKPSYAVLYNTMRLAEDLEDWPKCEWAAERILKLYPDAKNASYIQVKPVLGYAKLRQPGRMQEALDILTEAEKDLSEQDKKTSSYFQVLKYKALALGGWPAFDKNGINYEPNPGMGKPDEAYDIYWNNADFRKWALHSQRAPKYSLEWYRYHLEVFYFCRQAERIDSKFKARAQTFYNNAKSFDNFATLRGFGPEGVRIANLFDFAK